MSTKVEGLDNLDATGVIIGSNSGCLTCFLGAGPLSWLLVLLLSEVVCVCVCVRVYVRLFVR